jgi:uncharacterized BrkB/YihY/UPF0761 family membrane protein
VTTEVAVEWIRTLGWIVRGSPWGFAFTVALFSALYILVPMETPTRSGAMVAAAGSEVAE